MSDLADGHRRIAAVVEPLERMGVDAVVNDQATDDGDLCLTLHLRIPPALDAIDGDPTTESAAPLEARRERRRTTREEANERVDQVAGRAAELEHRITALEDHHEGRAPTGEDGLTTGSGDGPAGASDDLTDGERETLHALRALGDSSGSGEIADEVDATIQSVRSWLPKLVEADHVRAEPDPTDGRRKLYSPVTEDDGVTDEAGPSEEGLDGCPADERPDDEVRDGEKNDDERPDEEVSDAGKDSEESDEAGRDELEGPVYIASSGGSPSQVFHVRAECPQLRKSSDFVEKDRSVVPHHRPCRTCVHDDLADGLVAIADGSSTTTYHKWEDCPKLDSAIDVAVRDHEAVPNYAPCQDCVHSDVEAARDSDRDGSGDADADVGPDSADERNADTNGERDADTNGERDADSTDERNADPKSSRRGDPGGERRGDAETGENVGADGDRREHRAAQICVRNDLRREAVVDALDAATAIYHVQRDLALSRDETEVLLRALGVFDDLDAGGYVAPARAASVAREHVPQVTHLESDGGRPGG